MIGVTYRTIDRFCVSVNIFMFKKHLILGCKVSKAVLKAEVILFQHVSHKLYMMS